MYMRNALSKTAVVVIIAVVIIAVIAAIGVALTSRAPPVTTTVTITQTQVRTEVVTASPTTTPPPKPKIKVAMILPGTIQDTGWNTMAYLGLAEIGRKYGVETSYSERIGVADADRVAREYIGSGFKFVIFHGGEYLDIAKKLAPEYPDVSFSVVTSDVVPDVPPNLWQLVTKYYKAYYVIGYLAGLVTKTKVVGFVGAQDFPVYRGALNAFYLGAKDANPDVKVLYAFTGSWDDPVVNKEAAEAMIAQGADFITVCVDLGFYGVDEAAKKAPKHVWVVSMDMDKYSVDPDHVITSVIINTGTGYDYMVSKILEGQKGGHYVLDLGKGISIAPIRVDIPSDIKDKVTSLVNDIIAGKVKVKEITDKIIVPKG
ncbi:MAG: hypothetical protein B6U73_02905 [Desulfurococcales archaeon ex4484_204]|nr:MAG: hypothetical protein B6U73_02905 [Desulfurococcales archaeon ex4484_204]